MDAQKKEDISAPETVSEEQKDRNMGVLLLAWKVLRKARQKQPGESTEQTREKVG